MAGTNGTFFLVRVRTVAKGTLAKRPKPEWRPSRSRLVAGLVSPQRKRASCRGLRSDCRSSATMARWPRPRQRQSPGLGTPGFRYVLPRHKAANWVRPGRGRKSTRPGANGVVELTPFEFLDRLA
ncbi:MAG: hypothetical protein O3A37_13825, partial [Planctomycetota bacterium]|nr:hypothetical protein [Planctomycetota bacterium]